MNDQPEAGLRADGQAVALRGVRIDAALRGPTAEVTVTQRYRNDEATPVEAVYLFPLDEGAAVCGFEARLDGKVIVGRVLEREQAFEAYDDAMAGGHGAYLLDQERPDVFTASVGNLAPGSEVELTLRYVALVEREDDALRFTLPTTVAPRYVPARGAEVGQPEHEKLNAPHARDVPYGLAVSVAVDTPGLRQLASPTHPIETTLREGGADVRLGQDVVALDRDFVLRVTADPAPQALVAREDDGTRVALLTFAPTAPAPEPMDVVFLLDRSGSMNGRSIEEAKKALLLAIRALSPGDRFDVIGFGSRHESLFGEPVPYAERTLEGATRLVSRMKANLGGTEILAPLREALAAPRAHEGARRIVLLTDGQVGNEGEIIALARAERAGARVFTLGIGAAASRHLVKGVARASRGASAFIAPGERIEPKVLSLFAKLRTPPVDDLRIDWGGLDVEQTPREVPPVFADGLVRVFARVRGGDASQVVLHAAGHAHAVPLDLEAAPLGGPLPKLWARERMRELETEAPRAAGLPAAPRARPRRAHRRGARDPRHALRPREPRDELRRRRGAGAGGPVDGAGHAPAHSHLPADGLGRLCAGIRPDLGGRSRPHAWRRHGRAPDPRSGRAHGLRWGFAKPRQEVRAPAERGPKRASRHGARHPGRAAREPRPRGGLWPGHGARPDGLRRDRRCALRPAHDPGRRRSLRAERPAA